MKKYSLLLFSLFMIMAISSHAQEKRAGYYDNGKKKWEGHLDGDKKMGEWVFYHDNGMKSREGIYKDGVPYGEWKEYYRNGQVKSEGNYGIKGGKAVKHGDWTTYHKNGAKETFGKYNQGTRVGTWYQYNTLGIETSKKKF